MLSPLSPAHILRMCLQYFGVLLLLLLLRREWVLAVSVYILALFLRIGSMSGLCVRLSVCMCAYSPLRVGVIMTFNVVLMMTLNLIHKTLRRAAGNKYIV